MKKDTKDSIQIKRTTLTETQQQRAHRLALSTVKGDRCLMKHLRAYNGGSVPEARAIEARYIGGFAKYLLERVKPSSATIYLQKLYAMLRSVSRKEHRAVELPRISDLMPTQLTNQRKALSTQELRRLMEAPCRRNSTAQAFLFACFTGLRLSDIKSLKWSDIQETAEGPCIAKLQVKTHRPVVVPLGKNALAQLPERTAKEQVFDLKSDSTIRNDLRCWCRRAGVGDEVTFHTSRHTFASMLMASKSQLYIVSKLCGHHNLSTTESYLHVMDSQRWCAINRLDRLMNATNTR